MVNGVINQNNSLSWVNCNFSVFPRIMIFVAGDKSIECIKDYLADTDSAFKSYSSNKSIPIIQQNFYIKKC